MGYPLNIILIMGYSLKFCISVQNAILRVDKPTLLMFPTIKKFFWLPRRLSAPKLFDFWYNWSSSTGLTAVSKYKPRLDAQWAVGTH